MTRQRFSVDTNLLIYSTASDAALGHEQARDLMDALADADCVLTLQALAESFHAVPRKSKMPAAEAAALVQDWMELFPVAVADGRTLREPICLRNEHGLGFWDGMLVEAARAAEATQPLPKTCRTAAGLGPCCWRTPARPASTALWIDLGRLGPDIGTTLPGGPVRRSLTGDRTWSPWTGRGEDQTSSPPSLDADCTLF